MQERIIEKAQKLGIHTSSSNSLEKLEEIASQLGVADFDPTGDLSNIENILDIELNSQSNGSLNNNEIESSGDYSIREQNVQSQGNRFGEKEYNAAKDANGNYDKDYYKKKNEALNNKSTKARDINPKNGARGNSRGINSASKNKFKDSINSAKIRNQRFQNKISNVKAKAFKLMHPGEDLKAKTKRVAIDGAKKAGQATVKAVGKAAKAIGKMLLNLIKTNPWLLIVLFVVIFVFGILIIFTMGFLGENQSDGYYEEKFSGIVVAYKSPVSLETWDEKIPLDDFILGATFVLTSSDDFSDEATKALMIAIKTDLLSWAGYNKDTEVISNYLFEYWDMSPETKEKYNTLYQDVKNYLYLSKDYDYEIEQLSTNDALDGDRYDINVEDFFDRNDKDYETILNEIYNSEGNLALYDLTKYAKFYSYSEYNKGFWWPIGSKEETTNNIYGGTPTSIHISSYYGMRYHPKDNEYKMHNGIDIDGGCDQVIIATKSGEVINSIGSCIIDDSDCDGYGNYVMIKHDDEMSSVYAHMKTDSVTVKIGDKVVQGQKIGLVGTTGTSTGCHLHFEVKSNGAKKNPLDYVSVEEPRKIID